MLDSMSSPHEFVIEVDRGSVAGELHPPDSESTAAVLICSGFPTLDADAVAHQMQLVTVLGDQDIGAVTFSPRADGRLTHEGIDDAAAVFRWMTLRDDIDLHHIGVLGVGVGALVAGALAARTDQVSRLGLMFAVTLPDLAQSAAGKGVHKTIASLGGRDVHRRFFDQLDELNPPEDIAKHNRPTLVLHDAGDNASSASVYVEALEAAGCAADYLLLGRGKGPNQGSADQSRAAANRYIARFFASMMDAQIGARS